MRFLSFSRSLALLAGATLLLTGCPGCNTCGEPPSYTLTDTQRAWAAPYPLNKVLRFRNAATGYERTYRVRTHQDTLVQVHSNTDCPGYRWEMRSAVIERTDSASVPREVLHGLFITAEAPSNSYRVGMNWGLAGFNLPAKEVDAGRLNLPPATFAGRTYQQVIQSTFTVTTPETSPRTVARIYLTKAEGIIRFEERGGSIWDLL